MLNVVASAPYPWQAPVKLFDQYPLYELGASLQQLKAAMRDGAEPFDQLIAIFDAGSRIRLLLKGEPLEISYCRETATRLKVLLDDASKEFRSKEEGGATPFKAEKTLPPWTASQIKSAVEVFEHQFSAEVKKTAVYAVPRRGIFDTERLVEGADGHLPESIRNTIPKFTVSEFRQAGRCLAFGLFSASGFHALRAAECALKQYYTAFLGEPKKDDITMGLMASHLKDRSEAKDKSLPKPNPATLRTITDITSFDRNPLTHKELELSEDDAALLFNRAQGMISMMAREMIDRVDELQPDLPLVDAANSAPASDLSLLPAPESEKKSRGRPASTASPTS